MKTAYFILFTIIIFTSGCSTRNKEVKKDDNGATDSITIIRQPYKDSPNVTEYEIPVLKGSQIRHGIQKRYYQHGSLYSEIPYYYGKRNGTAYTYYQAIPNSKPVIWKEQPYINDTLHGTCRRYHRDGKLQAEYEFKKGLPATGLQEFTESGKPVKMPELLLSKTKIGQNYFITANLSENIKEVKYFAGDLVEEKYFPDNLKGLQVRNETGEVLIPANSKHVTISAVFYTRYRNQAIISKTLTW